MNKQSSELLAIIIRMKNIFHNKVRQFKNLVENQTTYKALKRSCLEVEKITTPRSKLSIDLSNEIISLENESNNITNVYY